MLFSVLFSPLSSLFIHSHARTHTHSVVHTLFAHTVYVSVAFSISLPVLFCVLCIVVSFICRQPTSNTHQNIRDVGKEKWQHSFPSYVFARTHSLPPSLPPSRLLTLFFLQCMRLCLFSFASYPILRIKPSSSPTPPHTTISVVLPLLAVANIIIK